MQMIMMRDRIGVHKYISSILMQSTNNNSSAHSKKWN